MKNLLILLLIGFISIVQAQKIKYGNFSPQLKADLKDTTESIVADTAIVLRSEMPDSAKLVVQDSLTMFGDVSGSKIAIIPYDYLEADTARIGNGIPIVDINTQGNYSYIQFSSGKKYYLTDDTLSLENRQIITDNLLLDFRAEKFNAYLGRLQDNIWNKNAHEVGTITKGTSPFTFNINNDTSVIRTNIREGLDSTLILDEGSFECWVKFDSVGTENRVIASIADTSGGNDFWSIMCNTDSPPHIEVNGRNQSSGTRYTFEGSMPIWEDEWHHIVVTGGGGNGWKLVIDDVVQTLSWSVTTDTSTFSNFYSNLSDVKFQIGANKDISGSIVGSVGEARIYSDQLTLAEIATNWQARRRAYLGY